MQGVCKLQFPGKIVTTATDDAIGEWSVSGANGWNLATYIYIYTSSTAQGGGGSFKNKKPIGEVGCCESGMAERIH